MNHVALGDEIRNDPALFGYAPNLMKPNREDCSRIAGLLNAREVIGHETGQLTTEAAYTHTSPATMLALDTAAGGDDVRAGEALWWLGAVADVEPISLAEGSPGRATLESLTAAGIIKSAERDAMIAAATVARKAARWQTIGLAQEVGPGDVHSALWPTTNDRDLSEVSISG